MTRESIPKKVKEEVLDEYDHKCAVCAGDRPHIHHIDEDATNNALENLLPLCPNCHLRDQHNPTRKIDIPKLQLFRQYKDPCILKSQFHPLYIRQLYLDDVVADGSPTDLLDESTKELVEFIASLEMGEFYSKRIKELIGKKSVARIFFVDDPPSKFERQRKEEDLEYRSQIVRNRNAAKGLIVELIRYQTWGNA